jgi:histidine triad (HIT) family protein
MDNCIFCKIIKGEIPASKIYEDEEILAFMDINPISKGHALVIPKVHEQFIYNLEDGIAQKLIVAVNKVNQAIRKSAIQPDDINLHLADGPAAGQEIPHVHFHLIPRFKDDGFGFKYPKNRPVNPKGEDLKKMAEDIKINL